MSHYFAGVLTGFFLGGIGGYWVARTAFNRVSARVAQYILAGRPQGARMGR